MLQTFLSTGVTAEWLHPPQQHADSYRMISRPIARAMPFLIDLIWLAESYPFVDTVEFQSSFFDFSDLQNLAGSGRAEVKKSSVGSEVAG